MIKNTLNDYRRDAVKYSYAKTSCLHNTMVHNYENDYQLILIEVKDDDKVQDLITESYTLTAVFDVIWSYKHLAKNKERLGINDSSLSESRAGETVVLKAIIFQMEFPQYTLTPSGSHQIDWSVTVLSPVLQRVILISNSIESFFYNSTLILGLAQVQALFASNDKPHFQKIEKDLEGAEGWNSFTEMFAVANVCADWLVLRNAEFLPDDFWGNDKDIDVLCREIKSFVFAVNAIDKGQDGANFEVTIESKKIDVDIRFIGDDYYDRLWEGDMLQHKQYKGVVPLLSPDNYFYSLLYHARIHKAVVKPIYIPRLMALAKDLGFDLDERIFSSDALCAEFMDAYFSNKGYKFTYPSDYPCFESLNRKVTRQLHYKKIMGGQWKFRLRLLMHHLFIGACNLLPRSFKDIAKRVLGK